MLDGSLKSIWESLERAIFCDFVNKSQRKIQNPKKTFQNCKKNSKKVKFQTRIHVIDKNTIKIDNETDGKSLGAPALCDPLLTGELELLIALGTVIRTGDAISDGKEATAVVALTGGAAKRSRGSTGTIAEDKLV